MSIRTWVIQDRDGNVLNTFVGEAKSRYVGTDWNGTTVASVEQLETPTTPVEETRRAERDREFKNTIDRMNPPWYNSLTDTQKTSLETWRQEWLDYPDTGILPTRIDIFN